MEACSHCGMEVLVNRAIFKPCHSLPNDHQLVFVCHHHHHSQFRWPYNGILMSAQAATGGGSVKVTIDYYYSKSISTSFCFANRVSKMISTLFIIQFKDSKTTLGNFVAKSIKGKMPYCASVLKGKQQAVNGFHFALLVYSSKWERLDTLKLSRCFAIPNFLIRLNSVKKEWFKQSS